MSNEKITAELLYNPYIPKTTAKFNNQSPKINSQIEKYENLPLKEWLHLIPEIYYNEMNGYDFVLKFTGTELDYEEVKSSFMSVFENEKIQKDAVTFFHQKVLEDVDSKRKKVYELIDWLQSTPNHRFDFETFWQDNSDVFEISYPYILIRGGIPSVIDPLLSAEKVESAKELADTELSNIPIAFYIEEGKRHEFRKDLATILERQDVRQEQLFFLISPDMDKLQVERVIRDLGVDKPQTIEKYDENKVLVYIKNVPLLESIRSAIRLLHNVVEKSTALLDDERESNNETNAEVRQMISMLENELNALTVADDYFVGQNTFEISDDFGGLLQELIEKIKKWKSKKTRITGHDEIEDAANEYAAYIQTAINQFLKSLCSLYENVVVDIQEKFSRVYSYTGTFSKYTPAEISLPEIPLLTVPEIIPDLLKSKTFEESQNDFMGFFKRQSNTNEIRLIEVCNLEQWRMIAHDSIIPICEAYMTQFTQNLSRQYLLLADSYHQHLLELIKEKSEELHNTELQLSDEEKKMKEDKDWLDEFEKHLKAIEGDSYGNQNR